MGKVVCGIAMSMDGCVAGPNQRAALFADPCGKRLGARQDLGEPDQVEHASAHHHEQIAGPVAPTGPARGGRHDRIIRTGCGRVVRPQ
jgi:hypothetical protein